MTDVLKPLTKPVQHKKFLVLDIESKDGPTQRPGFTRPFMVGVYDGDEYLPFYDEHHRGSWQERYFWPGGCVDQAMRHILRRKYRGWHIYAHNAGRFDYLHLLPWLMIWGLRKGYHFNVVPVSSAIQILDVWRPEKYPRNPHARRGHVWRFLDSFKLIPVKLDQAIRTFGTRGGQGKFEFDLATHEDDRGWTEYNRVDCVELYNVLERFHDIIELRLGGEVGVTAPSTSMKVFRRNYLLSPVPRDKHTHDFAREAYYGGRVEVFRKEGTGLRYFDINSSYPAAMLQDMPAGGAVEWDGEPPARYRDSMIGFVRADVEVPEMRIPPLPIRSDGSNGINKGKLIFPVGHLQGCWEWDELQKALSQGARIEKWYRSVWYRPAKLFAQYVQDLYPYRDKSRADFDPGMAQVVKILLNSLYGKFATKVIRNRIYLWCDPELPDDAVPSSSDPDCVIYYAEQEVDAAYIIPQISARITALARIRLYDAMLEAERRGGNVYYCDTDSIITEVQMPVSSELGALKDEYPEQSGHLNGLFVGPKLYMLTDDAETFCKVKAKGMQKRDPAHLKALARGEVIRMQRLEKIGTLARSGFMRGPRMVTVPRRLLPDAGKRIMLEDGTTKPHTVMMW